MMSEIMISMTERWAFEIADFNSRIIDDMNLREELCEELTNDPSIMLYLEQTEYLDDYFIKGILGHVLILMGYDLLEHGYIDPDDYEYDEEVIHRFGLPTEPDYERYAD